MKKIGFIMVFIFLTGLFSGLFFSTNLSEENNQALATLLLSGYYQPSPGLIKSFLSSLTANLVLVLIMLPSLLTRFLCPLPPAVLWYKSFAIGFCSGLIYLNAASGAFLISLVKMVPQNLFLIPAFLLLSACCFHASLSGLLQDRKHSSGKKNSSAYRISRKRELLYAAAVGGFLLLLGSLTEAVFHLIALSPS